MLKYQNLRFFNGESGELDFYYDETNQYWSGNIYLPRVASGLYETCNLYIFEEVITSTGHIDYIRPISENAATTTLRFEFIDDETSSDAIFVYDMVKDAQGNYEISIPSYVDDQMQSSTESNGITTYTESNSSDGSVTKNIDYKTVSGIYDKNAIHCNIAINSISEDIHVLTFFIKKQYITHWNVVCRSKRRSQHDAFSRLFIFIQNRDINFSRFL